VAGLILFLLLLAVQRQLLTGQQGYDIEMLPGRAPGPPATPPPSL